jgi:starch synthase
MESFLGGVRRAFSTFKAKDRLDTMRRSAMAKSFSWNLSAALYSALYRKLAAPQVGAQGITLSAGSPA